MGRKRALMALRGMGVLVAMALLLSFQTHARGNRAAQASGESVAAELVQYAEPNQVTDIMGVSTDIFLNLRLDRGVRLQSASPETVECYLPWPAGKSLYVIQGNNSSPTHSGKFRYAWDFTQDETGTEEGHPIVAVANGMVRVREYQVDKDGYGWGWYVVIEHQDPDGTPKYSLYGHLKEIDPGVQVNQPIERGEPVGKLGRTGSAGLPEYGNVAHLHFQFMDAIYEGKYTAKSVPGRFKDVSGDGVPKEGKWYTSHNSPPTKPAPPGETSSVLVIDLSTSMQWEEPGGGTKIDALKRAARGFLEMIRAENEVGGSRHQVSVVSFSDSATLDLPLTPDTRQVEGLISRFSPHGNTNMADALSKALDVVADRPKTSRPIMVFLTDGVPSVNQAGEYGLDDPEALKAEVVSIAQHAPDDLCFYAIGFGDPDQMVQVGLFQSVRSLDPDFLADLASTTGCGRYYPAEDAFELENAYISLRHQSIGTIATESQGKISQGKTVDVGKVSVEPSQEELGVTLNWSGSKLDLILTDPTGRQVDGDYPGANIFADARPVYIIIENPVPGDWVVSVFGRDVPQVAAEYYVVVSTRESSARGPSPFALIFVGILTVGLGSFFLIMLKHPVQISHQG